MTDTPADFNVITNSFYVDESTGNTVFSYSVDYKGTSTATTYADLGPEPTEDNIKDYVKTLYGF